MTGFPATFNIDNKDKKLYEKLQKLTGFRELENKDLFISAMVYGYKNKYKIKIKKKMKGGYFRTSYLKDKDWAIIKSIAVSSINIDILNNPEKIVTIAEEYAHGGIIKLTDQIMTIQFGTVEKWLELEVHKLYEEIGEKS